MKVSVIGDVILDIYKCGTAKKLSPEAPVPIITNVKTTYSAGGAANVAMNLASLGVNTALYGTTGNDTNRNILIGLLKTPNLRIELSGYNNCRTTTKTRIMADGQHILRIDDEDELDDHCYGPSSAYRSVDTDAVIFSDYNKGVINRSDAMMGHLRDKDVLLKHGKASPPKIYVDPKKAFNNYQGAYLIKPNEKEFRQFVGDFKSIHELVDKARISLGCNDIKNMLVTLGKDGMVLITPDNHHVIHSTAQNVYDVTGAGDTVLSVLVYYEFKCGCIVEAAHMANEMAGLAVSKVGNYIVNIDDINKASYKQVVVFTNGCFDILHAGHIEYLKKSKELGDYLVVGLNSDDSIRRIKGPDRPINDQESRKKVLEALSFVDKVVIFEEDSSYDLIKSMKPNIITKGGDYTFDTVVGNDLAEVVIIPFVEGYSTSSIINKL